MSRKQEDLDDLREQINLLYADMTTMMYNRGMSRILCEQAKDTFNSIIKFFDEDVEAGMAVTG